MPRYNLNHQDIETIVQSINLKLSTSKSIQEYNRILNLKSRLLYKIQTLKDVKQNDKH
jgi:hypothetical protein